MNKKIKTASISALIVFIAYALAHMVIPYESDMFSLTIDSALIVLGAAAGLLAVYTSKALSWKTKEGKVWLLLGLGYLGWAADYVIFALAAYYHSLIIRGEA